MGLSRGRTPGTAAAEGLTPQTNQALTPKPIPPAVMAPLSGQQQTFIPFQPGGFGSHLSNALSGMQPPVQPLQQPDQYRDPRPSSWWQRVRGF